MTTHSVLSCTKPGVKISKVCWMIPYPPTNVTTTRSTREPNYYWRWWWGRRWTWWQFLHSRINLFHTNFVSFTFPRMSRLTTPILWVPSIHMWPLLPTSTIALGVWLSKMLKLVTSTIVGDIVINFSFLLNMHSPCFYQLFFISSWHVFTWR